MEHKVFSRLSVTKLHHKDRSYNRYWECVCTCGNTTVVREDKLKIGKIKSCGCLAAERVQALQCLAAEEDRAYTKSSYSSMVQRCTNPNLAAYLHYGARGITVCDRWLHGDGVQNGWTCFFKDMGPRPRNTSIDRIDNTEGYFPDNCRWATPHEQVVNRGMTKLTEQDVRDIRAVSTTRQQAADQYGVSYGHIKKIRSGKAWRSV